jgi:hypothetical protein
MRRRLVLAAGLCAASVAAREAADVRTVLDSRTVELRAGLALPDTLPTHVTVATSLALTRGAEPVVVEIPVAWSVALEPEDATPVALIEPELSARIRAATSAAALAAAAWDGLVGESVREGRTIAGWPEETIGPVPARNPSPVDVSLGAPAWVRALTRGDGHGVAVPAVAAAPLAPPAPPLLALDVEICAMGLHLRGGDATLPERLVHLAARARLFNLATGRREHDHLVVLGSTLDGSTDVDPAAALDALRALARAAAGRLALGIFGEGTLPAASVTPTSGAAAPAAAAMDTAATRAPPAADPLMDLASSRLSVPPAGDPWLALARALRGDVTPALADALRCAEDPEGRAVEIGASRLGLGLAETHRRAREQPALRRALAMEVVAAVREAAPQDGDLGEAVAALVAPFVAAEPDEPRRRSAAAPLLLAARADGLRSPDGLARLLVAYRLAPEQAAETIRGVLSAP